MIIARVLIVDDEENIRKSLKGNLEDEGFVVATAEESKSALLQMGKFAPDVVLLDIWMPGADGIEVLESIRKLDPFCKVIMMSGHGTIDTAVRALKLGAYDFLEKPIHIERVLNVLKHALKLKELEIENSQLREELSSEKLIVKGSRMEALQNLIELAAPSSGWVFLYGEPGTGKELVARLLHNRSPRRGRRFIHVNCRADQSELEQALLHAEGGTLFLDEIEGLSPQLQKNLLDHFNAIEQGLGRNDSPHLDVRVITSSKASNSERPKDFDQELWQRLGAIPIAVPSLRERRECIPELAMIFLERYSGLKQQELSEEMRQYVMEHSWPGNVRELKNWVERAVMFRNPQCN